MLRRFSQSVHTTGVATEEQLLAFAAGGEQMVARVRLVLVLCLFAIPVFQIVYVESFQPALLVGLFASGAAVILALVFLALSRVIRFERWLPYLTSLSDVTLVSAALVAFLVTGMPLLAIKSRVVWEIYLLAIAATALRPRRGVAIATTVMAAVQYLAIMIYTEQHLGPHVSANDVDWPSQVSRLTLIAVAGVIATTIIRRFGRISHLAGTDMLTGAYNRTYFDLRLAQEVRRARRYGHTLTLVLADIDRFKHINDTLGHEIGDRALIHVVQCLKDGLRRTDVLFRHGGDELAVLMPETTADEAHGILQRIARSLRARPLENCVVTLSVGIATLAPHAADAHALVKAADRHLYAAKESGRDCIMAAAS